VVGPFRQENSLRAVAALAHMEYGSDSHNRSTLKLRLAEVCAMPESFHHFAHLFIDALPDISNLILVLVGVIMSLPKLAEKIEEHAIARYSVAIGCISVGLWGFFISVSQRRQATSQMGTLVGNVNTLVLNTNTAVTNTNTMVSTFALLMPQVSVLNSRVSDGEKKIEAAKGNPQLIATLQAQAADLREQSERASTRVLLAMVPGIVHELKDLASGWYNMLDDTDMTYKRELLGQRHDMMVKVNEEFLGRTLPIMKIADELRTRLLKLLPASSEIKDDQTEALVFNRLMAGGRFGEGDFSDYQDLRGVAEYLNQLAARVSQAAPSH
jgi:hypothetical protein